MLNGKFNQWHDKFCFFNHLIKARSIFKHMHAILIIIVATVTIKNCNDGFLRPIRDQTSIISIWRLIHQRKKKLKQT